MAVQRLWVRNFRSLVDVELALGRITVVQGANASGKTNLYRALTLLSRGAHGGFARTVLSEGGMPSMLWAGATTTPRRPQPVRMVFGVEVANCSYELAVGLPNENAGMFMLDAEIKTERAWFGERMNRHTALLDRGGISASARTDDELVTFAFNPDPSEPALGQLGEPDRFPELFELREQLRRWRFYQSFPTDDTAAVRRPQARVRRAMTAAELSDGTLRFLCLAAALLTPRPAPMLVFNEPETSLHPDVIPSLAQLIIDAGNNSQIVLTTHSSVLADRLVDLGADRVRLQRDSSGSTIISAPHDG